MKNSVSCYLIDTVGKYPEKVAVEDKNGKYTLARLLSNACDLAETLQSLQVRHQPIGVLMPKSREMLACFAGINLADCFYVPLDASQPQSRIQSILDVLECVTLVVNRATKNLVPDNFKGCVLVVEDIFNDCDEFSRANALLKQSSTIDTDPVYSIFTSGSTGTPKGVVVNHRGVIDYIDWAVETFKIDSTSVIGNQAPFYFDNSTLDIYLMMATGATLNIIPEENFIFPAKLIDYLNEHGITFVFWVPFVLISVANFKILDSKKPATLRDVFFAGEVMPNKQLNYWRKHLPSCRYVNLYGPTEITVDCTYYVVDRDFNDDEPLPIGVPCKNTDILILKDCLSKCEVGETGEICVRGSSLACGYYNNPEKTQDAFIRNPLNPHYPEIIYCTGDLGYWNEHGEVMFAGRKDSQIKHKGYRIELGEIENAVLGTDLVDEGCIIYNRSRSQITLIYSASQPITVGDLRKAIANKIPTYMFPSKLICEENMKRNMNGKIDRAFYNQLINGAG